MLSLAHLSRWQAGAGHLAISAVIGIAVLAAMILVWYPPPYFTAAGGNELVFLMVGVDVALGPLLTLAVYNPAKGLGRLRFDLAVIAACQVAALAYGVHVMYTARPAYLVYAVDRFDLVMANLLTDKELAKATPPFDRRPIGRPPTVGARLPDDPKLKDESLFLPLGGIDLTQHPRFFVPYPEIAAEAAKRAEPIASLRKLNPDEDEAIDRIVRSAGRPEGELAWLAARAPNRDFVVIVEAKSGLLVERALLKPW
jgi:hypothetical protein